MEETKKVSVEEAYLLQRLQILQQTQDVNEFLYLQGILRKAKEVPTSKEVSVNED